MRWLILFLLILPNAALAAWHRATTDHFVVYGEGSSEGVRAYAEKLEKFEGVLALMTGIRTEAAANRLVVFLVDDTADVQRQLATRGRNVAGFYSPRLWGTIAVVPRRTGGGGEYDMSSQIVLFHEYTHHFMLQNAPSAYPAWYVEGLAEYFSTADFERDGNVAIGKPAKHRYSTIVNLPEFPVERMLVPTERPLSDDQTAAFYAWSWLLTHYLNLSPQRKGQLEIYLKAFAEGASPMDAATKAFGSLKQLQKDLTAYRESRRWTYMNLKGTKLATPKVEVVSLTASENASMPMFMRTYRPSRSKEEVASVVAEARKLAARYQAEPMALDALAEFELDAEQYDAAQQANDAVIAARPTDGRALMRAARIAEARLPKTATETQWKAVRSLIVKANRAAPNDPYPLYAYFRWHRQSGTTLPKVATDGLIRAVELAPQVPDLRFELARQLLIEGRETAARNVLAPLINHPHSAAIRDAARQLIESKGRSADAVVDDDDDKKVAQPL